MGAMKLCACVCLSVLVAVVTSQRPPKRPLVQASAVDLNEMETIKADCNQRYAINDTIAHFARVASDCSAYAMCEAQGRDPVVMLCPAGLFFNDDMGIQSCVRPVNSNCQTTRGDPCVGRPDGYNQDLVRSQDFQGAYFICRNGVAVGGGWCELGEQYLSPERACFAIPDRPVPSLPREEPIVCHLQAVVGDSSMFLLGDTPMPCPSGLTFILADCGCR